MGRFGVADVHLIQMRLESDPRVCMHTFVSLKSAIFNYYVNILERLGSFNHATCRAINLTKSSSHQSSQFNSRQL